MEIQLGIETNDKLPEHPFWTFSLQLYHNNDVADALILFQQAYGLNANFILYLCWYAYNGQGSLNQARVRELLLRIRPWHERVVLPLRRIRDRLKPHVDSILWAKNVRQAVLLEELEAEHAEQLMIADNALFDDTYTKTPPQKCADICRSMVAYCRAMRADLDPEACDAFAEILAVMFRQLSLAELLKLCRKRLLHRRHRGGTMGTQLWIDL
ncbi:MAG: TIGR02444 family protein [Pseudomonadota bacterium]|nr:TIGR02444 family protein [Pseudomonadota bacterium]